MSSGGGERKMQEDVRGLEGHSIGLSQRVSISVVWLDPDPVETVVGQSGEFGRELVGVGDRDGGLALVNFSAASLVGIAHAVSSQARVQRPVPLKIRGAASPVSGYHVPSMGVESHLTGVATGGQTVYNGLECAFPPVHGRRPQ